MTEIVIYASAFEGEEREILRAACEWVRRITDNPNLWGDEQDFELIRRVRAAYPNIKCRWLEDGKYTGWKDTTAP